MKDNRFAQQTISYIWTHPNCRSKQLESIAKFIGWQFYKRLTRKHLDFKLTPNVKIRCHPDGGTASFALYCGLYDYHEMNFLLRYLRPSDSFLDIGANIGVYTLLAASIIENGTIYSFEALPKNYERLLENLKINQFNSVKTYSLAISNSSGSISFEPSASDCTAHIVTESTQTTITVPTETLDNLLKEEPIENITLAKMDIEGAELFALQGATHLLTNQHPQVWILELLESNSELEDRSKKVVDLLNSYGYNLYEYDADSNHLVSTSLENKQSNNVLAIADKSLEFVNSRLHLVN